MHYRVILDSVITGADGSISYSCQHCLLIIVKAIIAPGPQCKYLKHRQTNTDYPVYMCWKFVSPRLFHHVANPRHKAMICFNYLIDKQESYLRRINGKNAVVLAIMRQAICDTYRDHTNEKVTHFWRQTPQTYPSTSSVQTKRNAFSSSVPFTGGRAEV